MVAFSMIYHSLMTAWLLNSRFSGSLWFLVAMIFEGADGNKRCRLLRDQVIQDSLFNPEQVFKLLLNTSQFEFKLKEVSCESVSFTFCLRVIFFGFGLPVYVFVRVYVLRVHVCLYVSVLCVCVCDCVCICLHMCVRICIFIHCIMCTTTCACVCFRMHSQMFKKMLD